MKIADLNIGEMCAISLLVTSATARETKTKKPFLALELSDGTDTIPGMYWDWTSGNIPPVNTVLDINAQVTEWAGNIQLNIKSMATSKTRHLADFAPRSEYDIAEIYKKAYALMGDVKDDELRTLALKLLEDLRDRWITVPGAKSVHHNFIGGTLVHSYNVAVTAKAIAEVTEGANVDLTVVGAMLHDLGKLFTYRVNGVVIDMTMEGRLYEHIFIGAEFIGNYAEGEVDEDKLMLLRHIILSHHGHKEYGSPVTPQCIEAYIVHYADAIDATNEQIRVASKKGLITDRIRTLDNCPHLSHKYVDTVMF